MNHSGFLRDLARTAREEEAEEHQRWERWEQLTNGTLSSEEEADLRAEDPVTFEAFRPLGPDFKARMTEKIGLLVGASAEPRETSGAVEPPSAKTPHAKPAKKEPRGSFLFFGWRAGFLGSGLASAAAAWLLFVRIPPLPQFALADLRSNVEISRGGAEGTTPVLLRDKDWSVLARPSERLSSRRIESLCYVRSRSSGDGKLLETGCSVLERNPRTGAPKIGGHLPAALPAGPATLWIVLGYAGRLPGQEDVEKLPSDRQTHRSTWVAEPTSVEIRTP